MPNFSDNNQIILKNPDRGIIMIPQELYNPINDAYLEDIGGQSRLTMWFANPVYVHKTGETVRWFRNGVQVGSAVVASFTNDYNVHLVAPITGSNPQPGDVIANYIDTTSLLYAGITWKQLEPTKGVYDWEAIESAIRLDFAQAHNMKYVLRFIMDFPSATAHSDLPDWLMTEISNDGVNYDNSNGKGFSPNYNNSILKGYHKARLQAIKDRLGHIINRIELGSVGHWGEWHTYGTTTGNPNLTSVNQYIQDYQDVFGGSHFLTIRRPVNKAKEHGMGIYYDMFGSYDHMYSSWGLLTGINNGYTDDFGIVNESYPAFNHNNPTGGELCPWIYEMGPEFDFSTRVEPRHYPLLVQTMQALEGSQLALHPNYDLRYIDGTVNTENLNDFKRKIGYRIFPSQFSHTVNGKMIDISITMQNNGWGRVLKNYPVFLCFLDANNEVVQRRALNINLKGLLPSSSQTYTVENITYPTCEKLAIQVEGVMMPITTTTVDDIYVMENVSLVNDDPILSGHIGSIFLESTQGQVEIPLYRLSDPSIADNSFRVAIPSCADLVDPSHEKASTIFVETSSGTKALKKM